MYKLKINQSLTLNTKFGRAKINTKGYYRIITSKEGNHNKYLHRLIFEDFYGKILKGYEVKGDE